MLSKASVPFSTLFLLILSDQLFCTFFRFLNHVTVNYSALYQYQNQYISFSIFNFKIRHLTRSHLMICNLFIYDNPFFLSLSLLIMLLPCIECNLINKKVFLTLLVDMNFHKFFYISFPHKTFIFDVFFSC